MKPLPALFLDVYDVKDKSIELNPVFVRDAAEISNSKFHPAIHLHPVRFDIFVAKPIVNFCPYR